MKIKMYQIDAFTNRVFHGNPAAVCHLENWLPNETLLNIALENNLSETAFYKHIDQNTFELRWFTPEIEMDLCGHATLASAFTIFENKDFNYNTINFLSASGSLIVERQDDYIEMTFPIRRSVRADLPNTIKEGLNLQPDEVWKARDYMLIYENEEDIKNIQPNSAILNKINLDPGGIIVSAPGDEVDFVSRFFTPQASIFEDPVTGSAHCTLIPYWSDKLNKTALHARQISNRGGELFCKLEGENVKIKGRAVKYMEGTIEILHS